MNKLQAFIAGLIVAGIIADMIAHNLGVCLICFTRLKDKCTDEVENL